MLALGFLGVNVCRSCFVAITCLPVKEWGFLENRRCSMSSANALWYCWVVSISMCQMLCQTLSNGFWRHIYWRHKFPPNNSAAHFCWWSDAFFSQRLWVDMGYFMCFFSVLSLNFKTWCIHFFQLQIQLHCSLSWDINLECLMKLIFQKGFSDWPWAINDYKKWIIRTFISSSCFARFLLIFW